MGHYFTTGASRADIVKELLTPLRDKNRLHESKVVVEDGEWILWTVEHGEKDGKPFQFIGCYLLRQANGDSGDWGYKPMDETMGPCFGSVPLDWLDKYPCIVPEEYMRGNSDEWRKQVRASKAG